MRIRDVISPTICARFEEPTSTVLDRMRIAGVGHLIISRQQTIIGVASEKDLVFACVANADGPVGDIATYVPILNAEAAVGEAANLMRSHNVGCIPVVDNDAIAGVVTVEKLLELIGRGAIHTSPNRRRRILKDRGTRRRSRPR